MTEILYKRGDTLRVIDCENIPLRNAEVRIVHEPRPANGTIMYFCRAANGKDGWVLQEWLTNEQPTSLLSLAVLARKFQCTPESLKKAIQNGNLKAELLCGAWYSTVDDVEAYRAYVREKRVRGAAIAQDPQ